MNLDIKFDTNTDKLIGELHKMSKSSPKLVKKHLKKVGKNMTKTIKKMAKQLVRVGKRQKNAKKKYHNRFKTSKVIENTGDFAIGTYNSSPHAHLIEYGYKNKNGFISGKYPIKKGMIEYEKKMDTDLNEMLENVIRDGGF